MKMDTQSSIDGKRQKHNDRRRFMSSKSGSLRSLVSGGRRGSNGDLGAGGRENGKGDVESQRPSLADTNKSASLRCLQKRGSGFGLSKTPSVRSLLVSTRPGTETVPANSGNSGGRRGSWSSKSLFKSTRRTFFLISNQKWDELRTFLSEDDGVFGVLQMEELFGGGQNAIHFVCRYQPPLDIVKSVVQIYPEGVLELDSVGQTPLHVAVSWKASLGVIEQLISTHAEAAMIQDTHGRTPLQLACNKICFDKCLLEAHHENVGDLANLHHLATMALLEVLYKAAPAAIDVKDVNGRTVVDSAIRHGASDHVVKFLKALKQTI